MASSHLWQRSSIPAKPGNLFKQDLQDLSLFLVRSEVGGSPEITVAEIPRAKSANPFRSDRDSGFAETSAWATSPVSSPLASSSVENRFTSPELMAERKFRIKATEITRTLRWQTTLKGKFDAF